MRTEELQYFITVEKYRSMNLASEEFHVSQQTLSAAVKRLEQELGVQLLERSYVGVTVTEAGSEFLKIAKQFLENVETFKETHVVDNDMLTGKLNIYATPVVCSSILPRLIALFIKKYTKVEISVIEADSLKVNEAFEQDVSENKLMIINVLSCNGEELNFYRIGKDLIYEEFFCENYVVIAGEGTVLSRYKTISLKTLLDYPLIFCGTERKEANLSYHLLKQYGTPIVCLVSDNPYIYLHAIADGGGIGIIPTATIQNDLLISFMERVKVIPIKEKIESVSYWVIPKNSVETDLIRTFIDFSKKNKNIFK